jgi:hypothetical protein
VNVPPRLGKVVVATAAACVLTIAGPATAATWVGKDAPNDMGYQADIQAVRIVHTTDAVRVKVRHKDLTRRGVASAEIYFDTNPQRPGPEYLLASALYDHTDYGLFRSRSNWKSSGDMVEDCDVRVRLNFATNTSVFTTSDDCFGDPGRVRVAVRVSTYEDVGTGKEDWLKGKRRFSRWIAQG